jgi:hypothetical protein
VRRPAISVAPNLLTVSAAFGVLTILFVGDAPPLGGVGKLDVVTVTAIFVVTSRSRSTTRSSCSRGCARTPATCGRRDTRGRV